MTTPAPDADRAPEADVVEDPGGQQDTQVTPTEDPRYARRRKAAAVLVSVGLPVLAAIGYVAAGDPVAPGSQAVAQAPAIQQLESTGQPDPLDPIVVELDAAAAHHTVTGSYEGYPARLEHAAGRDRIVVVHGSAQQCRYGGIIDGRRTDAVADPTGTACLPEQVAALRLELTMAAGQQRVSTGHAANDALSRAVTMAHRAAQRNYLDGEPSFLGIDRLPIDGVAVVATDRHDAVVLRTTTGDCWQLTVLASGEATEAAPC